MKADKHDGKNDDTMGDDAGPQSTPASASGATEAERAIGRAEADDWTGLPEDRAVAQEQERFNIGSPARGEGHDIEFHEAPAPTQD